MALYSIATDPFDDPACLECSVLPICGGGCVNMRLKAQHFKEEGVDYCSPFRDRLVQYLEAYYDTFRVKEIGRSVFGPPDDSLRQKGYRMIQSRRPNRWLRHEIPWLDRQRTSHGKQVSPNAT